MEPWVYEVLRDELAESTAETKAAVQQEVAATKAKLEAMNARARVKAEQAKHEMEAKIAALRDQIDRASDRQKETIEQRIAAVTADYAVRSAKLEQAGKLLKEALAR